MPREVFILKNKSSYTIKSAQSITAGALLTAACVVLAYSAKSVFGTGPLRFTIENLPIFIGSFFYGPIMGGAIAICSDLLSCVFAGMAPMPLITAGACAVGVVSGIFYKYLLKRAPHGIRITLSVFISHAIGSMVIKSVALMPFYGTAIFWRVPVYVGIAAIESTALVFLMKKKAVVSQIEKTRDGK